MELIVPKGSVIETHKEIQFQWKGDNNFKGTFTGGFSFPVDEKGNPIFDKEYYDIQKSNYDMCMTSDEYINLGIQEEKVYSEFNLWKCDCGEEFYITHHLGGTCPNCEQEYNYGGQKIISFYGTGEDW